MVVIRIFVCKAMICVVSFITFFTCLLSGFFRAKILNKGFFLDEEIHKNKAGEAIYLNNLVKRKDAIGLISQLIKIADRMHNLRTLVDNHEAFQRKVFFSTLDTFIPVFIDEIDFKNIKNRALRKTFKEAVRLLKD